ncbi:hypothetical protein [Frankia sp. Cas3]|uniref:hypothetical protein n=1 Tax=Frankia sp. Cas3 TaxID=3073926 RepID=UPI002AD249FB|nr:hypothetical protein [Frankia sp. Cas3]
MTRAKVMRRGQRERERAPQSPAKPSAAATRWELLPELSRQATLRVLSALVDRMVTTSAVGTTSQHGQVQASGDGGEGDAAP